MRILKTSPTNYILAVHNNYKHFTNASNIIEQNPKLHLQYNSSKHYPGLINIDIRVNHYK